MMKDPAKRLSLKPQSDTPFVIKSFEEVVLGTLLSSPDYYHGLEFLEPEDFFYKRHRALWHILSTLIREGKGYSPQVVGTVYHQSDYGREDPLPQGFLEYLLSRKDPTGVQQAAFMLRDARNRRLLASFFHEGIASLEKGEDPEVVFSAIAKAQSAIRPKSEPVQHMDVLAERAVQMLLGRRYIPTGLKELDDLLSGGLPRGAFTVFGARPSMGKTSFARRIARSAIAHGARVYWFSFDQAAEQLLLLEACREMQVPLDTVRRYVEEDKGLGEEVQEVLRGLASRWKDIWIFDERLAPADVLAHRVRRYHRQHRIDLLVVDYLQLIPASHPRASDIERVSFASRTLKSLAIEMDIAVLALAQLSREVERRPGKVPVNSDLRDSGQLEQDADLILLLHRPGYYDEAQDPGAAKIIVSKNKIGPTGSVALRWNPHLAEFE